MVKTATCAQMKEIDRIAIEERGISSLRLMERAAAHVTRAALELLADQEDGTILILCGTGNNGGDGFASAWQLLGGGTKVRLILVGERSRLTPDAAEMCSRFEGLGGMVVPYTGEELPRADCIVDALFGVGLSRALEGDYLKAVEQINAAHCPVVSCDIPSGLNGDTGAVMGAAVKAATTVTFTCAKPGLLRGEGPAHVGVLVVGSIGIPQDILQTKEPAAE